MIGIQSSDSDSAPTSASTWSSTAWRAQSPALFGSRPWSQTSISIGRPSSPPFLLTAAAAAFAASPTSEKSSPPPLKMPNTISFTGSPLALVAPAGAAVRPAANVAVASPATSVAAMPRCALTSLFLP